eukprot:GHVS01013429.1.p1 GENE.GHVS01013429.1~~GHVS01013429.1.p1  ORF type:complete len:272 (+),score=39.82 GHVS01013429.1:134-949(+)
MCLSLQSVALRDILPSLTAPRLASPSILNSPLRSLKNSLKYTYTDDELEGATFPLGGKMKKAAVELALQGGDVRFVKAEAAAGFAKTFGHRNLTLHGTFAGGLLLPFNGSHRTPIQDRFYLGGATGSHACLKGFAFHGLGPVDTAAAVGKSRNKSSKASLATAYDYLGGDFYLNSQLALFWRIPLQQFEFLQPRAFVFANCGALVDRVKGSGMISSISAGTRTSLGFGLAVPVPTVGGWMQLTLGLPLKYNATSDDVNRLQMGLHLRSAVF